MVKQVTGLRVKKMTYDFTWKIVMLGDETTGKTSFTKRYMYNLFNPSERLTIGVDFHVKTIRLKDKLVKLQLWDIGSEDRFRFLLPTYCLGANAAFFLYNITNPSSLDHLPAWTHIIREKVGDIPIMLVGTKSHLEEQRAVTREQGIQTARIHNLSGFIEVSAKTGQNIERLFETMTGILFDRYPLKVMRHKRRLHKSTVNLEVIRHNRCFPTFKVNKYITLRLENGKTIIYVGGKKFRQCKYLLLDIPVDETRDYGDIESIDEAEEKLQTPWVTRRTHEYHVSPETEFWGHCSNIQAWYKYGYDTRILHRNLAFPLLKALINAGDRQARKVFKEEIAIRFESGYPNVVLYLMSRGYLEYLDEDELDTVLESPKFLKNIPNSILKKLPEWLADKIRENLENLT